jgi:hypothetical protein
MLIAISLTASWLARQGGRSECCRQRQMTAWAVTSEATGVVSMVIAELAKAERMQHNSDGRDAWQGRIPAIEAAKAEDEHARLQPETGRIVAARRTDASRSTAGQRRGLCVSVQQQQMDAAITADWQRWGREEDGREPGKVGSLQSRRR